METTFPFQKYYNGRYEGRASLADRVYPGNIPDNVYLFNVISNLWCRSQNSKFSSCETQDVPNEYILLQTIIKDQGIIL